MSIAKMLEFVKGDDRKYLPDDYEEYVNKQSKQNGNKIFAGENAETANSGMLKDAMMMNAEGVDAQTILKETGWGIGSDGRWRFEIDNSEARLLETPELGEGERFYLLSEWLEHDRLYEAYPDLRYVQVAQMPEISDKSYCSPDGETIIINPNKCVTEDDKLNAVLEEIQNSIQIREGFEEGASFEGTESYIDSQKDNEEYDSVDEDSALIDKSEENDIIKMRVVSGALNPYEKRAVKHANRYYEAVRKMKTDVKKIAQNTGLQEEMIQGIKNFVFIEQHDLGGESLEYFVPSYEMSQSWQRLIDGKDIKDHDLTLLYHEILEKDLMKQGYSQGEAHTLASEKYNYQKESDEYYAEINKYK